MIIKFSPLFDINNLDIVGEIDNIKRISYIFVVGREYSSRVIITNFQSVVLPNLFHTAST